MDIGIVWAIDIKWRLVIFKWDSRSFRSISEESERVFCLNDLSVRDTIFQFLYKNFKQNLIEFNRVRTYSIDSMQF